MSPALAFPLGCILGIAMLWLLGMLRDRLDNVIDTYHAGRDLIDAAGGKREARLQIENVRLDAALCRKFGEQFVKSQPNKLPANVVRLEFKDRGRPVSFTPDGAA